MTTKDLSCANIKVHEGDWASRPGRRLLSEIAALRTAQVSVDVAESNGANRPK